MVEPGLTVEQDPKQRPGAAAPPIGLSLLKDPGVPQRSITALFAWAVAVAPSGFSASSAPGARVAAVLALCAGVIGPVLVPFRKPLGRHVGISFFLLFSVICWVMSAAVLDPGRLDTVRATVGSVAFGAYALSWGEPWRRAVEAPAEEASGSLKARSQLEPFAVLIASIGVLAGLSFLGLAWQVREPTRAVLAHAAAILAAVLVVAAAGEIAVSRGRRHTAPKSLQKAAQRSLLLLALTVVAGAVLLVLRHK